MPSATPAMPSVTTALFGHDVDAFFATYWERQTVLMRGAFDLSALGFHRDQFFAALPHADPVKAVFQNGRGQHRELLIKHDQAEKLFDAGLSICAGALEAGSPAIRSYLDALPPIGGEMAANGYLSPSDKGFGTHFDNHSVWVVQVEGSKQWHYADAPTIPHPPVNCIYPMRMPEVRLPWYTVHRPDPDTFAETVLEPGDVLYIPAGTWHRTQATSYSLSITFAQNRPSVGQTLTEALGASLLADAACRRPLPRDPEAVRAALAAGVDALSQRLGGIALDRMADALAAFPAAGGDGAAPPAVLTRG